MVDAGRDGAFARLDREHGFGVRCSVKSHALTLRNDVLLDRLVSWACCWFTELPSGCRSHAQERLRSRRQPYVSSPSFKPPYFRPSAASCSAMGRPLWVSRTRVLAYLLGALALPRCFKVSIGFNYMVVGIAGFGTGFTSPDPDRCLLPTLWSRSCARRVPLALSFRAFGALTGTHWSRHYRKASRSGRIGISTSSLLSPSWRSLGDRADFPYRHQDRVETERRISAAIFSVSRAALLQRSAYRCKPRARVAVTSSLSAPR